jgi:hypothetical protein
MTVTVTGLLTDRLGAAEYSAARMEGDRAVEHRTYEAISSLEYRRQQPGRIEVNVGHRGKPIGEVVHLERTEDDSIVAVAVVRGHDGLLAPRHRPMYFSPELRFLPAATTSSSPAWRSWRTRRASVCAR